MLYNYRCGNKLFTSGYIKLLFYKLPYYLGIQLKTCIEYPSNFSKLMQNIPIDVCEKFSKDRIISFKVVSKKSKGVTEGRT